MNRPTSSQETSALIAFEDWRREIFNRPVPFDLIGCDGLWHRETNAAHSLQLLTRLWATADELIQLYSPAQIGQGFWFLHGGGSDFVGTIYEGELPLHDRIAAVSHIATLFERCFAVVCEPVYGHLNQGDARGANGAAYMFWDSCPLHAHSRDPNRKRNLREHAQIEDACLRVMERLLSHPHVAVQESAIHGLGHWRDAYTERVNPLLDRVIADTACSEEIRKYAGWARNWYIQ